MPPRLADPASGCQLGWGVKKLSGGINLAEAKLG